MTKGAESKEAAVAAAAAPVVAKRHKNRAKQAMASEFGKSEIRRILRSCNVQNRKRGVVQAALANTHLRFDQVVAVARAEADLEKSKTIALRHVNVAARRLMFLHGSMATRTERDTYHLAREERKSRLERKAKLAEMTGEERRKYIKDNRAVRRALTYSSHIEASRRAAKLAAERKKAREANAPAEEKKKTTKSEAKSEAPVVAKKTKAANDDDDDEEPVSSGKRAMDADDDDGAEAPSQDI
jgi:hypothetical protein